MSSCSSNFHGSLDVLLPLHIDKVKFIVAQASLEFLARIDNGRGYWDPFVEKVDDLTYVVHSQYLYI